MAEKLADVCIVCGTTLGGLFGRLFHLFGIKRCTRNPNICNRCDAHMQEGRIIELSVLFADLTSFTAMTNRLGAERSFEVVDSFFKMANVALVKNDAFIDKYIGDAVMAFFNTPIQNKEHAHKAVLAALDIQDGLKLLAQDLNLDLHARIGIAGGFARVGRLGSTDGKDYTAIGDAVNLAARLETFANPGEIMLDAHVYDRLSESYPDLQPEILSVRGFAEPIQAYRLGEASRKNRSWPEQTDTLTRRQNIGLGAVLFAIFGAPCATITILSPLALFLGAGSLISSIAPVLTFLDAAPLRISLQMFAVTGAVINLYVIRYGKSRQDKSGLDLSLMEKRKLTAVICLSVISVITVAFEMYAHIVIEGMPLF